MDRVDSNNGNMAVRGPRFKGGYAQLVSMRFPSKDEYDRVIREMPDTAERGDALTNHLDSRYSPPVFEGEEYDEIMSSTTLRERTLVMLRFIEEKKELLNDG